MPMSQGPRHNPDAAYLPSRQNTTIPRGVEYWQSACYDLRCKIKELERRLRYYGPCPLCTLGELFDDLGLLHCRRCGEKFFLVGHKDKCRICGHLVKGNTRC
jgi:hypothetical protein